MEEYKHIIADIRIFERTWGIEAYNELMKILTRLDIKIERLIISRNKWKEKYNKLKNDSRI